MEVIQVMTKVLYMPADACWE